jgi:hypothetical protein
MPSIRCRTVSAVMTVSSYAPGVYCVRYGSNATRRQSRIPCASSRVARSIRNRGGINDPKGYRRVTVVLYASEAAEADRLVEVLQGGGWLKANRSLVMREALLRLQDDLLGLEPDGVFRYFVDRQANRMWSLPTHPISRRWRSA